MYENDNRKLSLYNHINEIRLKYGIEMYGVDMVEICLANKIAKITTVPLKTPKLKAMVFINTENTIILNSNRSVQEQNYDCTHEFIHIVRHSEIQNTFTCYDTTVINNNFYKDTRR